MYLFSKKICMSVVSQLNLENSENFKNTGVKKLIIIGLAPKIDESHHNLEIMLNILDLQSICGVCSYTFALDFKMIMNILGNYMN